AIETFFPVSRSVLWAASGTTTSNNNDARITAMTDGKRVFICVPLARQRPLVTPLFGVSNCSILFRNVFVREIGCPYSNNTQRSRCFRTVNQAATPQTNMKSVLNDGRKNGLMPESLPRPCNFEMGPSAREISATPPGAKSAG